MRRLHLVELEDLPWLPAAVRDGGTDVLDAFFRVTRFYRPVLGDVLDLIAATGSTRVIDLCSGGGGGVLRLREVARERGLDVAFELTDRFPNAHSIARVAALGDAKTVYRSESVDALHGGGPEPGVRTMATALHHFEPDTLQAILAGIVQTGQPLAFFDLTRHVILRALPAFAAPLSLAVVAAGLFPIALAVTPWIRPLGARRLALTLPLPAIPALFAFDGAVSSVRAYTAQELLALARAVPGADGYVWHARQSAFAVVLTGRRRDGPPTGPTPVRP